VDLVLFYFFGGIAVVASLLVIGQRRPIYSVLLLIASFGALAGLYVLLDSPFVAVTQIIIYAGAIMVLFLFVVMLLNVPYEEAAVPGPDGVSPGEGARQFGILLVIVLGIELIWALARGGASWFAGGAPMRSVSSVREIGVALFTDHALAFEATSILILVAMVGAIVLARRASTGSARPERLEGGEQ
jgi:NADH-quinone oxidoreductase subunit J